MSEAHGGNGLPTGKGQQLLDKNAAPEDRLAQFPPSELRVLPGVTGASITSCTTVLYFIVPVVTGTVLVAGNK